jgi:hypothetical protein
VREEPARLRAADSHDVRRVDRAVRDDHHGATRDGFGHVPPAVGRLPGESEEGVAGADAARVGGRAAHVRVGASLHRDGAEPVEQRTQPHQGCALGRS